jgi:hypothetical protein
MHSAGKHGAFTIAVGIFRKDNGRAIRQVFTRFVGLCRRMDLLAAPSMAIDGTKFKAVNNRDRNFTRAKMARRRAQIEASVARYLQQLDTADRQEPSDALATKTIRLRERIASSGTRCAASQASRRGCSRAPISRSR